MPTEITSIAGYDVEEHEFLTMPGYDHCIVGVDEVTYRVCYDSEKVIEENVKQGMTREEAEEYFSFNQSGAFVGPQTPIFLSVGGAE